MAQRIVSGDVPEGLKNKRILVLDISSMVAGSKYRGEFEDRLKAVLKEIQQSAGEIIVFNNLDKEQIIKIVDIQIDILMKRLLSKKIDLEITPRAKDFLADKGYDTHYGARPLKRIIQRYIQDPLALQILEGIFKEGDKLETDLNEKNEKIIFKKL